MRVLIVDDHPLLREGLSHVLRELDPRAEVVEAEDATGAIAAAERHDDLFLILLDLGVPGAQHLSLLHALRARREEVPLVVLSATDDAAVVKEALDAGAMGFISKRSNTSLVVNALRLVLGGGIYVPPQALAALSSSALPAQAADAHLGEKGEARLLRQLGMTPRQAEVLGLLVQGKPTKVIAKELDLAENTVKTHIASILRLLNCANRTQALFVLSRLGVRLPGLIGQSQRFDPPGSESA
ncbi:MAG TPA: response regulator transcription factor [Burkholderiales bacterium]|nr:response regulator transcription factor [Burkholderiales bacterium]